MPFLVAAETLVVKTIIANVTMPNVLSVCADVLLIFSIMASLSFNQQNGNQFNFLMKEGTIFKIRFEIVTALSKS